MKSLKSIIVKILCVCAGLAVIQVSGASVRLEAEDADSVYTAQGILVPYPHVAEPEKYDMLSDLDYLIWYDVDFGTNGMPWMQYYGNRHRVQHRMHAMLMLDTIDPVNNAGLVDTIKFGGELIRKLDTSITGVHDVILWIGEHFEREPTIATVYDTVFDTATVYYDTLYDSTADPATGMVYDTTYDTTYGIVSLDSAIDTSYNKTDFGWVDYLAFYENYPYVTSADTIIQFEDFNIAQSTNIQMFSDSIDGELARGIGNLWKGNHVGYYEIDFGEGMDSITIRGGDKRFSRELWLTLDSPDTATALCVGKFKLPKLPGWDTLLVAGFTFDTLLTGTHDIYFHSFIMGGDAFKLDWFTFDKKSVPTGVVGKAAMDEKLSVSNIRLDGNALRYALPNSADRTVIMYRSNGAELFRGQLVRKQGVIMLPEFASGISYIRIVGETESFVLPLLNSK